MTAYYNEIDPKAAAWLRELIKQGHIADGVVDERSIIDVTPDELRGFTQCHFFAGIGVWSYALRSAGWADDRPVWTGSCPCQPFSSAGRQGGFDDERHLWPHWHHLISQCQPAVVFGEQVASKDGLGWLDLVSTDMEATGYAFGAADLCAAGIGAPHIRQRLFFGSVRLADTDSQRRDGINALLRQEQGDPVEAARSGEADGLADADGKQCNEGLQSVSGRSPERAGGNQQLVGLADAGCDSARSQLGDCAETQGVSQAECKPEQRADVSDGCSAGGDGRGIYGGNGVDASGLADTSNAGSQGRLRGRADERWEDQHGHAGRDCAVGRPGPTNGHWGAADWLFCRDGKWRPVEPGTFPLVNGAAERVGRLRGYGNAIVAQVAQTFIESMMEITA